MIDNIHDGSGAFASIIEGGVNQNHTKILIKSQPGGRINNKITIFAYRHPTLPNRHSAIGWKTPIPPLPSSSSHPANANMIQHPQPKAHKSYFPWPNFYKMK